MVHTGFSPEVVWEVDPPADGDPRSLSAQLDAIGDVVDSVLVPDNHTGRATVSSIAVARRVLRDEVDRLLAAGEPERETSTDREGGRRG